MVDDKSAEALAWQVSVWDKIAELYQQEIDPRFKPVIEHLITLVRLRPGQTVLDLGTGTGSLAIECVDKVGPTGKITAVDISPEMLTRARARVTGQSITNINFLVGRGEEIPVPDSSHDAIAASLSMMYVIDRATTAREIARVLRPGACFVASVWDGPEKCDIVRFQQIAGSFAPEPPVKGVGPGALANPAEFMEQLTDAGLDARFETITNKFSFPDFKSAWHALAGVTTSKLDEEIQNRAMSAVRESMWSDVESPRDFLNGTHYIIANKPA